MIEETKTSNNRIGRPEKKEAKTKSVRGRMSSEDIDRIMHALELKKTEGKKETRSAFVRNACVELCAAIEREKHATEFQKDLQLCLYNSNVSNDDIIRYINHFKNTHHFYDWKPFEGFYEDKKYVPNEAQEAENSRLFSLWKEKFHSSQD